MGMVVSFYHAILSSRSPNNRISATMSSASKLTKFSVYSCRAKCVLRWVNNYIQFEIKYDIICLHWVFVLQVYIKGID